MHTPRLAFPWQLLRTALLMCSLALPLLASAQAPMWRSVVSVQPDTAADPYQIWRTVAMPNGDAVVTGNMYYNPGAPLPVVDGQYHVVRLAPNGRVRWGVADYSDGNPQGDISGYTISQDIVMMTNVGNVVVAGSLFGYQPVPFGTADTLVNQNPTMDWNQNNGFVGELNGQTGAWRWAERIPGYVMAVTADTLTGDVAVAVQLDSTHTLGGIVLPPTSKVAVGRLHQHQWQWIVDTQDQLIISGLTFDPQGRLIVVGGMYVGMQLGNLTLTPDQYRHNSFVAQFSPTGAGQWITGARNGGLGTFTALTTDGAGSVWLAGNFSDTLVVGAAAPVVSAYAGGYSGYVAQLSSTGAVRTVVPMLTDSVGGYDPNSAWPTVNVMTLLADPRGGVLIGGDFYGRLTLGTTVLSSMREGPAGASWGWYSSDLLVARYGSAGWSWVTTVGGPKEKGFAGMGLMPTGQLLVGGRALAVDSLDFGTNIQRPNSWSFVATLGDRTPLGGATPTKPATLALWPNPAGTTAHLTLPATAGATTEVVLLDALGRVVRTQHLAPGTSTLDLRGLPAGLYLVRAGALTTRLIVRGAE